MTDRPGRWSRSTGQIAVVEANGVMFVAHLSDEQIEGVLTGMPYPARLWEILAWAEYNGAGPVILNALYTIPEQVYTCVDEIVDAVDLCSTDSACDRGCHHRRHPRRCSMRHDVDRPLAS
jgi:hypothetical protein